MIELARACTQENRALLLTQNIAKSNQASLLVKNIVKSNRAFLLAKNVASLVICGERLARGGILCWNHVIISTFIPILSLFLHFYLLHLNSTFLFNNLLIIIWVRLSSFPKLFLYFSCWLHIWRLALSISHIIDLWNRIWTLLLVYFIIICSDIVNYWFCHTFIWNCWFPSVQIIATWSKEWGFTE